MRSDIDMPKPGPGHALVRITRAGICGTDLELVKGYYPFNGIPGHEFVGEIVQCPDKASWEGRRVTASITIPCGKCRQCRQSRQNHCENRKVLGIRGHHGAFAEYLSVPLGNVFFVPDEISDEAAVFIEPLAAALRIQEQVPVREGDKVLVLGAGNLGQLIAQSLALTGCKLQVGARHSNQKSLLTSQGISWIDPGDVLFHAYELVVDATGTAEGFSLAQNAVRPQGVIVLKSTYQGDAVIDVSAAVVNEITVIGSRCGPLEPAIKLLMRREVDPTVLIDHRYPLTDALIAFERAGEPGTMKILFTPHTDIF